MSFYTMALFAHIVGVIVIFTATAIESLCLHRMRSATTIDQLREWASLTKTTAILFPVGGAAMIVSGVYMSLTAWSITIPWIALSVAVVAVMSVFGPVVNSRRLEAIAATAATEPSGAIPAVLARRVQDPVLLASVHTLAALGLAVVYLKVARPDLVGASPALAVAVIAGVLSARLASRSGSVPAENRPVGPVVASERSWTSPDGRGALTHDPTMGAK